MDASGSSACDGSINAIKSSIVSAAVVENDADGNDSGAVGCTADADTGSGALNNVGVASSVVTSIATVPANGVGPVRWLPKSRPEPNAALCDQPVSLVMVAFQMA